jgi:purine nucleosidase
VRLWVDTDVGTNPDDAVALLCAAAHPDVELVGVSTVGGDIAWRARVARVLVDTRVVERQQDLHWFIEDAPLDALLAIGPLTNVAALVRDGYQLPRLAIMGGARAPVDHRGARRAIEHNFGADPEAAALVLAAGSTLLCPLDVTVRMCLDGAETARLAALDARLPVQLDAWGRDEPDTPVCLHDPLALLALVGEPVVQIEPRRLAVDPDGRLRERDAGVEHDVVIDVDEHAAKARILDLLERGRR